MSEWKWCQRCDHRFDAHGSHAEDGVEYSYQGPCLVEECDCTQGYYDLSDLL